MAASSGVVNVTEIIDRRGFKGYQIWILAICFMVAFADGYDGLAIGVTAPLIVGEFHLPPAMIGPILSAAQWGSLLGSIIFGPCADRWGRRRVLIATMTVFVLGTFAMPFATSFETLAVIRFVTGLGLGGASPCFIALMAEYTPRRMRGRIVEFLWAALPGSGVFVGLIGAYLITDFGWRSVYYVGGIGSAIFLILVIAQLPESLGYMAVRGAQAERMRRVLARLAPGAIGPDVRSFTLAEETRAGMPVKNLFTGGRTPVTLLLWLLFFFAFGVLLATFIWTPTLLKAAGLTPAQAALCFSLENFGGIVATLLVGVLIDRFGYVYLAYTFVLAMIFTSLIAYSAPDFLPVAVLSTFAGFFLGGSTSGTIAVAVHFYPTFIRSTGLGWSMGLSRLGSASFPLLVGALVASQFTPGQTFLILGSCALVCSVALLALRAVEKRQGMASLPEPQAVAP
jgi:AAHS family 4-hydroxybenzoate transporter-like MFS transporter